MTHTNMHVYTHANTCTSSNRMSRDELVFSIPNTECGLSHPVPSYSSCIPPGLGALVAQPFTQSFHFILLNSLLITTARSRKNAVLLFAIPADFRQGSSVDAKTMREVVVRKQDFHMASRCYPTDYLLVTKEECYF